MIIRKRGYSRTTLRLYLKRYIWLLRAFKGKYGKLDREVKKHYRREFDKLAKLLEKEGYKLSR